METNKKIKKRKLSIKKLTIFIIICCIIVCFVILFSGEEKMVKSRYDKILLIGIDAMDPKVTDKLMSEGMLPNFLRLKEIGSFSKLSTVLPAESPVAWTTIATGTNPGKHGLFDFVTRNPENYLLEVSITKQKSKYSTKFESPIGASYGSIVTKDIKFEKALEIVSTLLIYAKDNGITEFELTAAPVVYENKPNQNLDFAMLWLGFKYSLHYISSAIKLNKDEDIISRFQPTVRRNIRKTFRDSDIRVEINERYNQFYPILLSNKARHNVKPTHSLEELISLKELLPNHLKLFMLYYKDIPIAGSSMLYQANSPKQGILVLVEM